MVYSQIWLNIIREDCHLFFIFLWMYDVSKVVLAVNSLRHNFNPRFGGCWTWQVVSTTLGNTERQTHPSNFVGETTHPSRDPRSHAGKAIAILCIVWMTLNTKSMRSLSALLLHNMYMLQNCSSAIINSIGNIIQALYKALFVI